MVCPIKNCCVAQRVPNYFDHMLYLLYGPSISAQSSVADGWMDGGSDKYKCMVQAAHMNCDLIESEEWELLSAFVE